MSTEDIKNDFKNNIKRIFKLKQKLENDKSEAQKLKDALDTKRQLEIKLSTLNHELNQLLQSQDINQSEVTEVNKQIVDINEQILAADEIISSLTPASPVHNLKYSAKTIRLGKIYQINKLWQKFIIIGICSIFGAVITWLLLQNTGIYSSGVSGIIQGIARIVRNSLTTQGHLSTESINLIYNLLFWITYIVVNIPLLIFSYFKVGKQFTLLTTFYLFTSNIFGFLINLIPNSESIFLFGKVLSSADGIRQTALIWSGVGATTNSNAIISMFVYGIIYGILTGFYFSILYILGGSTGGTDIPAYYTQKKKNKSIGLILTYFNLASLLIGIILGSFITFLMNHPDATVEEKLQAFFSPNLITSILATGLMGVMFVYLFPKTKMVKVQVYSNKTTQIASELLTSGWIYKIMINQTQTKNATTFENTSVLETVCLYIDLPTLIQNIRQVDENEALITIYPTIGVDGDVPTRHYIK